ncbi:adenine methyltransferase [Candidatus Pacearchaeota archaeon]|nr:adenine methyltransferase [Candidatus Pacearchaeota archaeon]|tara:strand:- start:2471 stop:2944 length:474 start_codon:yes stop_codon:yes gene_type:complete
MNKSTQLVMFSSKTGDWETPQDFFEKLSWRFGPFDLDPCANAQSAKCGKFFTKEDDGIAQEWTGYTAFVNPPYGRGIEKWIKKGYDEALKSNTKVVMLIPARTDTKYWHQYVMKADEVYFVKGRLKFGDSDNSAPFPSAVVVFDGGNRQQIFGAINR